MRNSYSKEELKKLAEMYVTLEDLLGDPNYTRFTEEQRAMYGKILAYNLMGINDKGEYDSNITYNLLDTLAEYQVDQYVALGKKLEEVKNDLPLDSNLSEEQKLKQEKMRDKFAESVTAFNTVPGCGAKSYYSFMVFFSLYDETADLADKLKLGKKNEIKDLYLELVLKKADEKFNNLSEEDKKYFEVGRKVNLGIDPPISIKFDDFPQEWKHYAEEKRKEIYDLLDKTIDKYGVENIFYKNYKDSEQVVLNFYNKQYDIDDSMKKLCAIPSGGHTNSESYNEIINAFDAYVDLGLNENGISNIQDAKEEGLRLKKKAVGTINRFEDALTNYLEDKWKPRKSPMGEQRFDKVFEILEKVNPEKAEDMREFHAMKNASKSNKTVDFETYCQNKKAEKECLNFSDDIQKGGVAEDFVVINKVDKVTYADLLSDETKNNNKKEPAKVQPEAKKEKAQNISKGK